MRSLRNSYRGRPSDLGTSADETTLLGTTDWERGLFLIKKWPKVPLGGPQWSFVEMPTGH